MKLSHNFPILLSLVALLAIALAGCGHSARMLEMDKAELLMDSHPDSSLNILCSIPRKELRGDKEKARHALLTVMAKDKCYLPLDRDSDFLRAVDYYRVSGPDSLLHRASYYLGRIHFDRQEYPSAILSFFQAKDIADKKKDYFWAGMAARGISDTYNQTYNASEELRYAREELDNFQKSGRQPYIDYAMLDLARSEYNKKMPSYSTLYATLDSANKRDNRHLIYLTHQSLGINYMDEHKPDSAIFYFNQCLMSEFSTPTDSLYLILSLIENKNFNMADSLISLIKYSYDPLYLLSLKEVAVANNDYTSAYEALQLMHDSINTKFQNRIGTGLSSVVVDYLKTSKENAELSRRNSYIISLLIVSLSLLLLAVSYIFFSRRNKNQQKKINDTLLFVEELLLLVGEKNTQEREASQLVRKTLKSKYSEVETWCEIMTTTTSTSSVKRKIADRIINNIESISFSGVALQHLTEEINESFDNVVSKLLTLLPDISNQELKLFVFSILGFSGSSISFLLKEKNITAVYNRKRRLKEKLKRIDNDASRAILSLLE